MSFDLASWEPPTAIPAGTWMPTPEQCGPRCCGNCATRLALAHGATMRCPGCGGVEVAAPERTIIADVRGWLASARLAEAVCEAMVRHRPLTTDALCAEYRAALEA